MNDDLKEQLFTTQALHDFNPLTNWRKQHRKWVILWITLFGVICLMFLFRIFQSTLGTIGLVIGIIGLAILSIWIHFDLKNSLIATNWDDMDYSRLQKMDFPFNSSDGLKQAAFLYIPDGIEFKSDMIPHKTLIGLHGWGSHHREMDRYCLPTVEREKFLYFSYDSFGVGLTPGSKNNFNQFIHAQEFIAKVLSLPFVAKGQVAVVGMSLGAAKAAYAAYPNPNIRAVVMLSGPYDLIMSMEDMTRMEYFIFKLFGFQFKASREDLIAYSGMHSFTPEGIVLTGNTTPTSNDDRVLLLANQDDPAVTVKNTNLAIQKLNLSVENYRIFPKGKHVFYGNEPYVALEIYTFLQKIFH